jgi:hypothetical protein
VYSGEYDVCDVTLSISTPGELEKYARPRWDLHREIYTRVRYLPKSSNKQEHFFCVGVVHSGEYDVCDVTLSVYPHRASLKNMSGHGGIYTVGFTHGGIYTRIIAYCRSFGRRLGFSKSALPHIHQNPSLSGTFLILSP